MRRLAVRLLVATAATCVMSVFVGHAWAQQAIEAHADRGTVSAGEPLRVSGSGWPAGERLQASICGNQALAGSVDCDLAGSRSTVTDAQGAFSTDLIVGLPPSPCPCVVFFVAQATPQTVRFPIEVVEAGDAPTRSPTASGPAIELVDVRVDGAGPWSSWLGGAPERTLVVTVRNPSAAPILPNIDAAWGRGDAPTRILEVTDLEELAAGEQRTFRLATRLDPLSLGRYTIAGEISAGGTSIPFSTRTSTYPWLWIAALVVALQVVLVRHWWHRKRGRHQRPPTPSAPEPRLVDETDDDAQRRDADELVAASIVATSRATAQGILDEAAAAETQARLLLERAELEVAATLRQAGAEARAALEEARLQREAAAAAEAESRAAIEEMLAAASLRIAALAAEVERSLLQIPMPPAASAEPSEDAKVIDLRPARSRRGDPLGAAIHRAVAQAFDASL